MKMLSALFSAALLILASMVFLTGVAVIFSGCGRQDIVLSGTATIKHEISLDSLRSYFIRQCLRETPYATDAQIEFCADEKIADILNSL